MLEKSKKDIKLTDILLQIAKFFETDSISDSIKNFERILNEFRLPKIKINEDELSILVNSVNVERLKNNPIIFTFNEIENLYKDIN